MKSNSGTARRWQISGISVSAAADWRQHVARKRNRKMTSAA